ncbi:MAG: hypothetical protein HRU15_10810, partial [Planctomycetes bacterium]|nr:hypothetical protein [Planctomycetota bacterium]
MRSTFIPIYIISLICICAFTTTQLHATVVSEIKVLTDGEAHFISELQTQISNLDANAVNKLFDYSALADIVIKTHLKVSNAKFIRDFKAGFTSNKQLATAFMQAGSSLTYLRCVTVDGDKRLLYRLLDANGRINFLEFKVLQSSDGKWRCHDYYSHASGEFVSRTVSELVAPMIQAEKKSVLQKLFGSDDDEIYSKSIQRLDELNKLVRNGKGIEALRIIHSFPEYVQNKKMFLILASSAASMANEAEYSKALKRLENQSHGADWANLMLIDAYILKKEYNKCLDTIHKISKRTLGDAWLDLLSANVLLMQEDFAQSLIWANKALTKETLIDIHWLIISVHLQQKDFEKT